jgi:hypothetical protein
LDQLIRKDGEKPLLISDIEMQEVMYKFESFTSPTLRQNVCKFKRMGRNGVIDGVCELRGTTRWPFVQDNKFPSQGKKGDKVFVFKISEVGPGSGVDLIQRMQLGGDLQDAWIMFDHVKRVKRYTTFACHVYDSCYCKVMTIALCDMMSETHDAQAYLWHGLNGVMVEHGVHNVNFKGFMADSAQIIGILFVRFMVPVTKRCQCREQNVLVSCIGPNACKGLPINSSSQSLG